MVRNLLYEILNLTSHPTPNQKKQFKPNFYPKLSNKISISSFFSIFNLKLCFVFNSNFYPHSFELQHLLLASYFFQILIVLWVILRLATFIWIPRIFTDSQSRFSQLLNFPTGDETRKELARGRFKLPRLLLIWD